MWRNYINDTTLILRDIQLFLGLNKPKKPKIGYFGPFLVIFGYLDFLGRAKTLREPVFYLPE